MYQLVVDTSPAWVSAVLNQFDLFMLDHAACERKASGMAMSLVAHYPDRPKLITPMIDLAIEELSHFKEVMKWIQLRGLIMPPDQKDPYVGQLRQHFRREKEDYLLDRLLIASIIEARGHERFALIAENLAAGPLRKFYRAISQSEERHFLQFLDLANLFFPTEAVYARLDQLLSIEADIITSLPIRAALH